MVKWLGHFKLGDELFIIDRENLKERPWEEINKIQQFLQVPVAMTEDVSCVCDRYFRMDTCRT